MKFSQILTVAVFLSHAFAADLVENDNLVSLAMLHNGSLDRCAIDVRSANLDGTLVVDQKYFVKIYGSIHLCSEAVYINLASLLDLELLSCNINDCVHKLIFKN